MANELPVSYIPPSGGIFSGGAGGVLGDADQFLEAAGGLNLGVSKLREQTEALVKQGVPRAQAAQQVITDVRASLPTQQAGLLGALPILPIAAAVGAYFLLPEKYKMVGSLAAGAGLWFLTQKQGGGGGA